MKNYSFLQEVVGAYAASQGIQYGIDKFSEAPAGPRDGMVNRMRVQNIVNQPFRSAGSGFKKGAVVGGLLGGLLGARRGAKGAITGAIAGAGLGGAAGGATGALWGSTFGQVKNLTNSRKQIIDRDNAIQKATLRSPFASGTAKRQAQARIQKNNLIDANLRNYRDAIAVTPDRADRADIKRQYRETDRWIGDRHAANMQYT